MDINDTRLDKLIEAIEEYRRRLARNNERYDNVEYISTGNENEKIKASCCHIIEARRGCGKTTFISKALSGQDNILSIYDDCQKYIKKQPNLIILGICKKILDELINIFNQDEYKKCENNYKACTKGICGFLKIKFKKIDKKINEEYKSYKELLKSINLLSTTVSDILNKPEEQVFSYDATMDNSHTKRKKISQSIVQYFSVNANIEESNEMSSLLSKIELTCGYKAETKNSIEELNESKNEKKCETHYTKTVKQSELIDNLKVCFTDLFNFIGKKYNKRVVVFLDDFYQIEIKHQPRILQYFHGIYKESKNNFCIKVVAIPDSIKINDDGQKLFSKKDDFPTITLNYDLSNMDKLVERLVRILISIDKRVNILKTEFESLFTSGTLIYLVMASGGIPRDFMALFSDTLINARQIGKTQIIKNHLYAIISELQKEKANDREIDLIGFTSKAIDESLREIEKWIDKTKTNVMLYPADKYKHHEKLFKALINLRYIHIISEHVTPESKNSETVGILLDMTLYATSGRLPNGFKICEFWQKDAHSNELRRAKIFSFEQEFINQLERG